MMTTFVQTPIVCIYIPLTLTTIFQKLDNSTKHYYEVICENQPCKLYFDIEFKKELNKSVNGVKLLQNFIELLISDLKVKFDISDINEKEHVINLTSTTEKKFSHHIIVNHPQLIFIDNYSAGKYVQYLCQKMKNMPEMILVMDEKAELTNPSQSITRYGTFIDEGVYTKNRNFRLYLSSKFNKNMQLKLFCADGKSDKTVFLESLVSYLDNSQNRIKNGSNSKPKLIEFQFDDHTDVPRINWTTNTYNKRSKSLIIRY